MRRIILVAHDIRSTYNVGSLLRTADGLGLEGLIISGYTPFPKMPNDVRLPHIADKIDRQIHKTALGAEESLSWRVVGDLARELNKLRRQGFKILALEQTKDSQDIKSYQPSAKLALIVGNELTGLDQNLLKLVDNCLEIPMRGQKESFNVAIAAAIALYQLINA